VWDYGLVGMPRPLSLLNTSSSRGGGHYIVHNFIKVSPHVLNHAIQQGHDEYKIIMRINRQIINYGMKLMEMGGREEILLERMATILINPYLKRANLKGKCIILLWHTTAVPKTEKI
jgi:hypothetical protein